VLGHGGAQVHAGRAAGFIGRQRQVRVVGQPDDGDDRGQARASAIFLASRSATASLGARSQRSVASLETSSTVFSAPPITPGWVTSLATIQSQPLRASLARAWASTSLVSAAKPTTSFGRSGPAAPRVARMSGFSTRRRAGGPSLPFFSLTPN